MSQGAPRTNKSAQSCLTLTIAIKCSASLAVSALQELPHSLYTFHRSSNQPSSKMGTPFNRADSGFNRPEYQGRGPNLADQYGQHRVPRRFQEAISYYNGRLNLQTLVDCLRAIWPNETEKTLDIHISLRRVLQHSSFRDREFGLVSTINSLLISGFFVRWYTYLMVASVLSVCLQIIQSTIPRLLRN